MNNSETGKNIGKRDLNPLFNPFPGLRPFCTNESLLFFGREQQSDEILQNIEKNRFVAVVGASGSGKSSLIYCGLVPTLYGGFVIGANANWDIVTTRPGINPIGNLAFDIVKSLKGEIDNASLRIVESALRSNSLGLVEAISSIRSEQHNVLIIFDQFEELFRYKRNVEDAAVANESFAFVKLITEAVRQTSEPIYVVLTMRSDFISECSQYHELTSLINRSQYLVPQMTIENLRSAITGPIAIGGGAITPQLLHLLLSEIGDNPDHLPILQHALMRTWDYWTKYRRGNEPMGICHYEAVGRMQMALSEHANEAYDELSVRGKEVCELIFKLLTDRGIDNIGIRRPTMVSDICKVTNASFAEVLEVVNAFRKQGRSFLSPPIDVPITANTVIDISHESLMRIWDRLRNWVDEEANSSQMYLRLSEASAMYQEGKIGLWRPPDLLLATVWKEKQKPTYAWAMRYDSAFERTMEYLNTSECEYRAEEENKIRIQRRTLRRTYNVALILGIAVIFAVGAMIFAFVKQVEAEEKARLAEKNRIEADANRVEAENNFVEANMQRQEADNQRKIAESKQREADEQRRHADEQRDKAEQSEAEVRRQKDAVEQKTIELEEQRLIALEQSVEAMQQKEKAELAREQTNVLRMLSISKSLAIKSRQLKDDVVQKSLLAYQAYKIYSKYSEQIFNNDIYNGLYTANKQYGLTNYAAESSKNIRVIKANPNRNSFYSLSGDGILLDWNFENKNPQVSFLQKISNSNDAMDINKSGNKLAIACQNGKIEIVDLDTKKNFDISIAKTMVDLVVFSKNNDNQLLAVTADSSLFWIDCQANESRKLANMSDKIKSIALSNDMQNIVVVLQNSGAFWCKIDDWNNPKFEKKQQIDYSASQIMIAEFSYNNNEVLLGDMMGNIAIWSLAQNAQIIKLSGHNARISSLQFNKSGSLLASASYDGKICLWSTADYNRENVELKDDNNPWVYSISFDKNDNSIFAAYKGVNPQCWDIYSSNLAENLLPHISRNFTQKEWNMFVGEDIEYEKVRDDLE